jgi:hypothetical protein
MLGVRDSRVLGLKFHPHGEVFRRWKLKPTVMFTGRTFGR